MYEQYFKWLAFLFCGQYLEKKIQQPWLHELAGELHDGWESCPWTGFSRTALSEGGPAPSHCKVLRCEAARWSRVLHRGALSAQPLMATLLQPQDSAMASLSVMLQVGCCWVCQGRQGASCSDWGPSRSELIRITAFRRGIWQVWDNSGELTGPPVHPALAKDSSSGDLLGCFAKRRVKEHWLCWHTWPWLLRCQGAPRASCWWVPAREKPHWQPSHPKHCRHLVAAVCLPLHYPEVGFPLLI